MPELPTTLWVIVIIAVCAAVVMACFTALTMLLYFTSKRFYNNGSQGFFLFGSILLGVFSWAISKDLGASSAIQYGIPIAVGATYLVVEGFLSIRYYLYFFADDVEKKLAEYEHEKEECRLARDTLCYD